MHPPAPRGVGPLDGCGNYRPRKRFQSTRPVRGGTLKITTNNIRRAFQSTRPVRGGTATSFQSYMSKNGFQSTRPVRGGTRLKGHAEDRFWISIHPPRAGRDAILFLRFHIPEFQSTRPVRGGTPSGQSLHPECEQFQSTRPVRGGTLTYRQAVKHFR